MSSTCLLWVFLSPQTLFPFLPDVFSSPQITPNSEQILNIQKAPVRCQHSQPLLLAFIQIYSCILYLYMSARYTQSCVKCDFLVSLPVGGTQVRLKHSLRGSCQRQSSSPPKCGQLSRGKSSISGSKQKELINILEVLVGMDVLVNLNGYCCAFFPRSFGWFWCSVQCWTNVHCHWNALEMSEEREYWLRFCVFPAS